MLLSKLITGDPMGPRIARKGGGGGTSTTTSGVPDEWKPYITESLQNAQDAYRAGALSEVAGLTPEQQASYGRQLELGGRGGVYDQLAADSYGAAQAYRDAAGGTGLYGANALQDQTAALTAGGAQNPINTAVQQALGQSLGNQALGGTLGSARAGAQTEKAAYDAASGVAAQELAARRQAGLQGAQGVIGSGDAIAGQFGRGAATQEGVGQAIQQQQQNELDATHQGLQRIFGFYGSPAVGSQSSTTTSGGGK